MAHACLLPADQPGAHSPHQQNIRTCLARATAAALYVYLAVVFVNANVHSVKVHLFITFINTSVREPAPPRPVSAASEGPTASAQDGAGPSVTASAGARARLGPLGLSAAKPLGSCGPPRSLSRGRSAARGLPVPESLARAGRAGRAPGRRPWQPAAGRLVQVAIAAR